MKRWVVGLAVVMAVSTAEAVTITHGDTTVSMDFVTVGNPHNPGDTDEDGYGSVGYTYRIGTYEVNENQWDAVVAANTEDLLDDAGWWSGEQPVAAISWNKAAMFCNWLTSGDVTAGAYTIDGSGVVTGIDRGTAVGTYGTVYVIPTENEWYKAAYYDPGKPGGAGYWDYPTKHDDPSVPDGIDSAADAAFDAVFNDGYLLGGPKDADKAGVLSAYGTMAQGGNVHEWNETLIYSDHRGYRGASWGYVSVHLRASARGGKLPAGEGSDIGFRVASVIPEPTSIIIWSLLGALTLTIGWWRRRRR